MKKRKAIKRRTCGAMSVHHRLLELDPNFRMRQAQLENATAMRMSLGVRAMRKAAPITIPVVVHVVYKTPAENISAARSRARSRFSTRIIVRKMPINPRFPRSGRAL